jgi:hypothetical protein
MSASEDSGKCNIMHLVSLLDIYFHELVYGFFEIELETRPLDVVSHDERWLTEFMIVKYIVRLRLTRLVPVSSRMPSLSATAVESE